ncbi:hypothetical protein RI054_02g09080 [Pseudoscourfieldia marina]|eukprot:CAMPEP_0119206824 /NCGR_PEP_ID=MMETSP1316-20130426/40583_1 /TAXON_ID=41880 /ORGANISM="Pycnococcus provasolii, Strain RCC2336" /LENGTH=105 /DNA_ID=CAMNT_0007203225 /DNA_START=26 /DNA_END=343 /DNA_ORIENTATION=-
MKPKMSMRSCRVVCKATPMQGRRAAAAGLLAGLAATTVATQPAQANVCAYNPTACNGFKKPKNTDTPVDRGLGGGSDVKDPLSVALVLFALPLVAGTVFIAKSNE